MVRAEGFIIQSPGVHGRPRELRFESGQAINQTKKYHNMKTEQN